MIRRRGPRMRSSSYPPEYRRGVRESRGCTLRVLLPLGVAAGLIDTAALVWGDPWLLPAAFVSALFLFGLFAAVMQQWDSRHAFVVPYFREPVPGLSTFCGGASLARHLGELDALAIRMGLLPLSAFGFNDDLAGEALVWHDAKWGLEGVSGLLERLRQEGALLRDALEVVKDLEAIEGRLREAERLDVPFCFLLRIGDGTSGHEISVRQGHF